MLNKELIDFLKKFDTPTISNALDIYRGSRSADGYTKYPFISANKKLEPIVGIARTARIKASNPPILSPEEITSIRLKYYEYISKKFAEYPDASPICVIEDLDWPNPTGSFWGEVNVALHKGLGIAGTITSWLLRDLDAIDKNYQVLANGIGPSHAYVHVVEFNTEVNLLGLKIKPNDIIHADRHGAVIIPRDALKILPKAIQFMKDKEEIVIKASKEKDFNFEKLKIAWQKANSMTFWNYTVFEIIFFI